MWAPIGTRTVRGTHKDDKRQITADLVCAATGDIRFFELIFGGKSDRCLPTKAVREEYEKEHKFLFKYSDNHWANESTKCALFTSLHEEKVARKKAQGMSAEAAEKAVMVVLLDCWPVNLKAEVRK